MDHPFAITLDPGTSLINHTGSWRTLRPEYVNRLPPCNHACPAGEDIQGWLAHAESGDYESAWHRLTENNPLPAIMGRVCYHPCEDACNRAALDSTVGINSVERFLGDLAISKGWRLAVPPAVSGKTVLEVGAGIGDHTHYYLDRGCSILATEARPENLRLLCQLMPTVQVALLDMDNPRLEPHRTFDVVHCYGLLYHLHNPERALEFLGACCQGMMFLETCVSFGSQSAVNLTGEKADHPTQAASGMGCRPTRPWILQKLRQLFPHVYLPRTQPNHKDFPVDWTAPERHLSPLSRAVFIASRAPIENDMLLTELPDRQERHP